VTDRIIEALIIQGISASNPIAPALTRTTQIYEISLAQVYVRAGTTSIVSNDITDERDNIAVCGKAVPNYVPTNDDIVTVAQPNKLLRLNSSSKLPASITGDAETVDGKHASDFVLNANRVAPWIAGDNEIYKDDTETTESVSPGADSGYVKKKEYKICNSGSVRVGFSIRCSTSNVNGTSYGRIYINGVAVGSERVIQKSVLGESYIRFVEDINVNYGDLLQIYVRVVGEQDSSRTYCSVGRITVGIDGRSDFITGGNA
jgi:hypothetical protein